ncbi:radical SAM protein [Flavobacterium jejuense]|uniref:Radical SAM protein n=1 Tax=Flavobacterium jejuense TaxID=1544455 RepID=A0ABX0IMK7_9FLAO|nr:radical SAM protein [Flavobacterium jejuense]NHN25025.1 radical SAM protein [Flavobacterium jejuense]
MKDILLITPPFTQLNTPYPATAYIKGFLNTKDITAFQMDLGIEVILELFSKHGLTAIFSTQNKQPKTDNIQRIFTLQNEYIKTIDAVIAFLQGKNPSLARQICSGNFLPEASRFDLFNEDPDALGYAFGSMGMQDKAKHLATLYLEDISDFIVACVDANFGFSRYAERLGRSANSFDDLYAELQNKPTYIDTITLNILKHRVEEVQPKLVLFSVPFPGNLYSAFRCAQFIKANYSDIKIAMGGGFPNTELRDLKDKRVFEFFDFITLDDGELPVELLYNFVISSGVEKEFKRTFLLENNKVVYKNNTLKKDYKQSEVGTPNYSDLQLDNYILVIEIANPMHSLWSDGRWNKLTMAHGCYWGKCTFCDISLDYIKLYEPVAAKLLVDRMEELIAQTGETGFHFVDEAAPPALMREVALEILRRDLVVSWWTNIRFEKSFTADLCVVLKASGCIAVSGGLEVASDRLLELIKKGVTVEQVAQVTRNFTESGIMVHAYLMYGYPTQTIQETIDSLEMVRQLFELGVLQSGFWHQFAMTAHSPVGLDPDAFGVIPQQNEVTFANNDIVFKDKTGINHDKFSFGLKKSLFNYMHGICFDYDLQDWFDFKVPKTKIAAKYISNCLEKEQDFSLKSNAKVVWLGTSPIIKTFTKSKKGNSWEMVQMIFHDKIHSFEITLDKEKGEWFYAILDKIDVKNIANLTLGQLKKEFEENFEDFELFWHSKPLQIIRNNGLITL